MIPILTALSCLLVSGVWLILKGVKFAHTVCCHKSLVFHSANLSVVCCFKVCFINGTSKYSVYLGPVCGAGASGGVNWVCVFGHWGRVQTLIKMLEIKVIIVKMAYVLDLKYHLNSC